MNWLIIIVFFMQALFHWLFEPLIIFSTPVFEARAIGLVLLGLFLWIFSGKRKNNALDEEHY